ncbi:MAG: tyrosine recombinase [Ghiorsea sp.]|nr:tyrosine recombinase [Ghiorsea sp.]
MTKATKEYDDIGPEAKIEGIMRRMAMLYNWSNLTVEAYQHDLISFHRFIIIEDKDCSALTATTDHVTAYLKYLKHRGLVNTSIQRQRSAMATWFHYLQNEKVRDDFPMQDVAKAMKALRLPKHLSEKHMEDLLAAPDTSRSIGIRDRCVLELLYATGLRVSELASLKVSNFNRRQHTLRVIGKGNKEREVPYGEESDIWLSRWLDVRNSDSVYLFPSRGSHLTRQTLWQCVNQYAKQAGIYPLPSPHVLRHAFATHLLNHGADLRVVQTLLGHENITTTEIYTHVSQSQLHDEVNRSHPMGKRKTS